MAKIYTKSGDKGKTGIHGGERVDKYDIRIEVNGTIDELNSVLGLIRALISERDSFGNFKIIDESLKTIQTEIMSVMSIIATPDAKRSDNPNKLNKDISEYCETLIDQITSLLGGNTHFLLPGGTVISAQLHIARTIARRAERRLWEMHKTDKVPDEIARFLNRLSDLLFVMARYIMKVENCDEEKWKSFRHKGLNVMEPDDKR